MDMGSLSRNTLQTILNYNRDPYVHWLGSLNTANIDSSSHGDRKYGGGSRSPGIRSGIWCLGSTETT